MHSFIHHMHICTCMHVSYITCIYTCIHPFILYIYACTGCMNTYYTCSHASHACIYMHAFIHLMHACICIHLSHACIYHTSHALHIYMDSFIHHMHIYMHACFIHRMHICIYTCMIHTHGYLQICSSIYICIHLSHAYICT